MRKQLVIQAIFCLMTLPMLGQKVFTFSGKVLNVGGEPLVGAQFKTVKENKVVGIADVAGAYSLEASDSVLRIIQMGYEDLQVVYGDGLIIMQETSSMLNAVFVSENKRAKQLKNATISLETIQPELISNTAPTNLEETIGRINGVQVVDNQPTIRSGSGWSYGAGSRVQVLIDGVPILSGDAGQPLWNFVPTEGVDGVEIIKGASSVIYGSSALNGVINIKTKKPSNKPFTQVTTSAGFYNLPKRESLRYQGNKRNTVSNITAYHTGIYKGLGITLGLNALNDESYKMSDYDKRVRGTLGLRKTVSKHNLIYGLNTTYQQGTSGSFLLWDSYDLGYTALDSGSTDNRVTRLSMDPYVKWNIGKFSHSINTRYLSIDNDVDNGDPTIDQSNSSNLVYAEYQSQFSLPKNKFNATGGLVAINTVTRSPLYSGIQEATNYAVYLQLEKAWNRLTVSGGARYEQFMLNERSEGKPVFRAGLNYKVASYTFLRASFGQGYRFPSIAESYITTTVGPVSIFPNDQLVPETGTNLEVGIKQGFKLGSLNLMADAAVFQMTFDNMMEFTFGQWGAVAPPLYGAGFKTLNTGRASVTGAEVNLSFQQKTKNLEIQGFAGYTYAKSLALEPNQVIAADNSNKQLTYINTSTANNALKYRPVHLAKADAMITYKKWKLGVGVTYQSAVQNIDTAFVAFPISAFVPGVQESIDKKLTAYTLINARIGYEFTDSWKTNFIVSNLTNTEYAIRPADLGAPRSVRLQVTYTLDKSK
ncbi:MAG: outer membrane receptor for ferrienterochelin and colicins [Bacteroidia bacterium]|jgi:outer membrane receptor for ferrienterochelin and colicins